MELKDLPGVMNAEQADQMMAWAKTPEGQAALVEHAETVIRQVYGPKGVEEMFGTANADPDEPARTFDERLRRCYELAAQALMFGTAPKGAKLVHGTMRGPRATRRIGHAWLRLPGHKVWEPINAKVYDEAEWVAYARARVDRIYTKTQTGRMLVLKGHYGRWHESRHP